MTTAREPGLLVVVLALVALVAGCSSDGSGGDGQQASASTFAILEAGRTGEPAAVAELPAPTSVRASSGTVLPLVELRSTKASPFSGVSQSTGFAQVTLLQDRGELCVHIVVAGLSQPTAAHLQESPGGGSGQVVLALKAPPAGDADVDACVSAPSRVLERIERTPSRFAISVHTETSPDGALRGQLR